MGQTFSLATLSAGSASIDVPELSDLTYEKTLGTARLMKSIRARHQNGLVVVKLVTKPFQQDLGKYVRAIRRERDALVDVPNALGYQRILETSTNGYLVRQYLYSSLYDRISTRPFLEDIEKKWLAYQLLCALRDCHARNIYHGDIKTENILVTSWNWLYLTDFSGSYKKTYLPEDNPADFSYFFDNSGRRTCYIAPERFLGADEKDDHRGVTWAMDVFSVGCVIAELFTEAPIFSLSQLYKYRKGEYDPKFGYLSKIQDQDVHELICHMIQLEPEARYSAEEYLNFWRRKAFPEYFYSFLHQYMGMITDSSSGRNPILPETNNFGDADDRIDRLYYDFDKIAYFLGYEDDKVQRSTIDEKQVPTDEVIPVQVDLPNNRHQATASGRCSVDDGSLIFLTLVVSSIRNTARATARLRACDLMLAFAERITDEAKLDRVLPYVVTMLNDRADIVKIAAIRTTTQLISLITVVSPVNAYVFTEYIRPRLLQFISGQGPKVKPAVRATYASCLATLAHTSLRILDMVQALRADGSVPTIDPEAEDDADTKGAYQNLFDVARQDLIDHFEAHTKALLTDSDASVRRAFLGSVSSLCVFFGSSRASDAILSHLNTYLNDKDWILKCALFQTIVGVAAFVGGTSLEEFILPLMIQALTDPEEFVVEKVLSSFASMAELGLFQRSKIWEMVDVVARFMMHPNIWIREAAAHFVSAATRYLSQADIHCIISPLVQAYLKFPIIDFEETNILDSLRKPLPRHVLDMAASWANSWASNPQGGLFWKPVQQERTPSFGSPEQAISTISSKDLHLKALNKVPKGGDDEKWLTRLRNIGLGTEDEFKLLSLREYIFRMASRRPKEGSSNVSSHPNKILSLKELKVTPQTIFFEPNNKNKKIRRRVSYDDQTSIKTGKGSPIVPHTIADALLDASSSTDDPPSQRKISHNNPAKERLHLDSSIPPLQSGRNRDRSGLASPASISPSERQRSPASASDVNPRTSSQLTPVKAGDQLRTNSSRPSTGSLSGGHATNRKDLKHKSSAINLLNKKETPKTLAETSTTSTNAFGRVDGPFTQDANRSSPQSNQQRDDKPDFSELGAGHTYDGNDPHVIKLLDTLASENFPLDKLDFGNPVTPMSRRHTPRRSEGSEPSKPWRPEAVLVATFGEHTGPINRVIPSPDHAFFITGSDDGTVKIWDSMRLERNLAHRSRHTHKHGNDARVKCVAFVENTHTFISCATDGSIHVVRVDYCLVEEMPKYGKLRLVREYNLPKNEYAVWVEHFKFEANSVLMLVTNASRIIALDLRNMTVLYTMENPVQHGTPTCFCVDKKHTWLLLGTSHGVLDLWDLRFRLRLKALGLAGGSPIHRLQISPFGGSGKIGLSRAKRVCVAGGTGQTDITIWDLETAQCKEVFRAGTSRSLSKDNLKIYEAWQVDDDKPEMLSRFAKKADADGNLILIPDRGIRAFALGQDGPEDAHERHGFLLAVGVDKKIRFWDVNRANASMVISGLDLDEEQPKYHTSQPTPALILHTERTPQPGPSAPNASSAGGGGNRSTNSSNGMTKKTRLARPTFISLQQQHLLKTHLDSILDVALLEYPVRMSVSVDRAGVVYVFQ